jgi:hypothetical protein
MPALRDLAQFDAGQTIQFAEAGRRQRTLAELGRLAGQGDYQGAQAAAFAGGEPEWGLKLKQMSDAEKERLVAQAASFAFDADTPEKWEAGRQQWLQEGYDIGPFEARDALLSRAMTIQDRIALMRAQREGAAREPSKWIELPDGSLAPRPGGPADPEYLKRVGIARGTIFDIYGDPFAGGALPALGDEELLYALNNSDLAQLAPAPAQPQSAAAPPAPAASAAPASFAERFDLAAAPPQAERPPQAEEARPLAPRDPADGRDEAFLQSLPPHIQDVVRGVANYEIDPRRSTSIRGNQRLMIVAAAKRYDPTYDQTVTDARFQARKSFTSTGQQAQQINVLNLALQHIVSLMPEIEKLDNTNFMPLNVAKNILSEQLGRPEVPVFRQNAEAVATEVAKVFRGVGAMSEREIEAWKANFNVNASPTQMREAIKKAVELLSARLETLRNQYEGGMGRPIREGDPAFVSSHTNELLQKHLGMDLSYIDPRLARQPEPGGGDPELDALLRKYGGQ